ncbi:hypothetical protein NDU88_003530 [Pleurodeles waltl]|uniref:SAND domain-containing protein n=1 Tax=Pleurodeles waltl TaxID=8319 RepID=A0AAV7LHB4_PLEWA|nr:hypothetical protein NDU88_003530 [Pleurodeles waltl]
MTRPSLFFDVACLLCDRLDESFAAALFAVLVIHLLCARSETLRLTERDGCHKAFHALLTWLLGRDLTSIQGFWQVIFKDYNLECYAKLPTIQSTFIQEMELGKHRKADKSRTTPKTSTHKRQQGKRKATEEGPTSKVKLENKQQHLEVSRFPLGNSIQTVSTSVQRAVTVSSSENPVTCGAVEGILIKQVLESAGSKKCIKVGGELYTQRNTDEASGKIRSRNLKATIRTQEPHATQVYDSV